MQNFYNPKSQLMIKQPFFWLLLVFLAGCGKVTYYKTAGGMPYEYFPGKDTLHVRPGYFMKADLEYKINDSVIFSTYGKLPVYIPVDEMQRPYDVSEVFTRLKQGDSVVCTQFMDTFIKRNPMAIPPRYKKGDRIITTIRVLRVFTTQKEQEDDEFNLRQEWMKKETAYLENYMSKNNIHAQKTRSGAYVQVLSEGQGKLIDSGNYVTVNYTGHTFEGKVFDSNTDSSFQHVSPLQFPVGSGTMIRGLEEGLELLRPNSTAKIYIPSLLGYADKPPPGSGIKPYDNLIFDIKVLEVQDKAPQVQPMVMPNVKNDSSVKKKNK